MKSFPGKLLIGVERAERGGQLCKRGIVLLSFRWGGGLNGQLNPAGELRLSHFFLKPFEKFLEKRRGCTAFVS